jgi:hypothetical protein
MTQIKNLLIAVLFAGVAVGVNAQTDTCSTEERAALAKSSPYVNELVSIARHQLSYVAPEQLQAMQRDNPDIINVIMAEIKMTAEDETALRKEAATALCTWLNPEQRSRIATVYAGEAGRELARQQLMLYVQMFSLHEKMFKRNAIKAIGNLN